MKIEVLNVSKYRENPREGDDVPLVLPGAVFGIFDGATDPRGTVVDGIGAGRLAALTVAAAVAELAMEPGGRTLPAGEILARLSDRLAVGQGRSTCPSLRRPRWPWPLTAARTGGSSPWGTPA